ECDFAPPGTPVCDAAVPLFHVVAARLVWCFLHRTHFALHPLSGEAAMKLRFAGRCALVAALILPCLLQEVHGQESSSLVTRGRIELNLAGAESILAGARKQAAQMG